MLSSLILDTDMIVIWLKWCPFHASDFYAVLKRVIGQMLKMERIIEETSHGHEKLLHLA